MTPDDFIDDFIEKINGIFSSECNSQDDTECNSQDDILTELGKQGNLLSDGSLDSIFEIFFSDFSNQDESSKIDPAWILPNDEANIEYINSLYSIIEKLWGDVNPYPDITYEALSTFYKEKEELYKENEDLLKTNVINLSVLLLLIYSTILKREERKSNTPDCQDDTFFNDLIKDKKKLIISCDFPEIVRYFAEAKFEHVFCFDAPPSKEQFFSVVRPDIEYVSTNLNFISLFENYSTKTDVEEIDAFIPANSIVIISGIHNGQVQMLNKIQNTPIILFSKESMTLEGFENKIIDRFWGVKKYALSRYKIDNDDHYNLICDNSILNFDLLNLLCQLCKRHQEPIYSPDATVSLNHSEKSISAHINKFILDKTNFEQYCVLYYLSYFQEKEISYFKEIFTLLGLSSTLDELTNLGLVEPNSYIIAPFIRKNILNWFHIDSDDFYAIYEIMDSISRILSGYKPLIFSPLDVATFSYDVMNLYFYIIDNSTGLGFKRKRIRITDNDKIEDYLVWNWRWIFINSFYKLVTWCIEYGLEEFASNLEILKDKFLSIFSQKSTLLSSLFEDTMKFPTVSPEKQDGIINTIFKRYYDIEAKYEPLRKLYFETISSLITISLRKSMLLYIKDPSPINKENFMKYHNGSGIIASYDDCSCASYAFYMIGHVLARLYNNEIILPHLLIEKLMEKMQNCEINLEKTDQSPQIYQLIRLWLAYIKIMYSKKNNLKYSTTEFDTIWNDMDYIPADSSELSIE